MHLNATDYRTIALPTNEQWTWSLFHELEKISQEKQTAREFFLQWRLVSTTARKDAHFILHFGLQRHLQWRIIS